MNLIFILAGGIAFAVAVASLWFAFQRPSFALGIFLAIFRAALPIILKRKSPEEEAKDHDRLAHGKQIGNEKPWGHEKGVDS